MDLFGNLRKLKHKYRKFWQLILGLKKAILAYISKRISMSYETNREQTENWLKIGLGQADNYFTEVFYFDKRDNQFFSIVITDYFLFDDRFVMNEKTSSDYSDATLKLLADRMQRIENMNNSILGVPKFGKLTEEELISKMDSFLNLNAIDLESASVWEIEESGDVIIDLRDEKPKYWWQFWK